MLISPRWLVAAGCLLLALGLPQECLAQGMAVAPLSVSARVALACSVITDATPVDADTIPSVRVVCGRSALRALRVSTDSGDAAMPVVGFAGHQRLSGGEVVFSVPSLLATMASRRPIASLPRATEPATVVVTLHF